MTLLEAAAGFVEAHTRHDFGIECPSLAAWRRRMNDRRHYEDAMRSEFGTAEDGPVREAVKVYLGVDWSDPDGRWAAFKALREAVKEEQA